MEISSAQEAPQGKYDAKKLAGVSSGSDRNWATKFIQILFKWNEHHGGIQLDLMLGQANIIKLR